MPLKVAMKKSKKGLFISGKGSFRHQLLLKLRSIDPEHQSTYDKTISTLSSKAPINLYSIIRSYPNQSKVRYFTAPYLPRTRTGTPVSTVPPPIVVDIVKTIEKIQWAFITTLHQFLSKEFSIDLIKHILEKGEKDD